MWRVADIPKSFPSIDGFAPLPLETHPLRRPRHHHPHSTPDIFNVMIFATPMVGLYFIGSLASYLLVLRPEGKQFPWGKIFLALLGCIALAAIVVGVLVYRYHFHFVQHWPFLVK